MVDQVLSSDFLDLTAYYLAVASVDEILLGMEADPLAFSGIDLASLQAHRQSTDAALRRFSSSVDAGIDTLLRDSTEKAKLRVKTRLDSALRGPAFTGYSSRADFMVFYLPKLRLHTGVLKDVFGNDYSQAMRIAQAAEITLPIPRLFKLAGIRMTSGKLSILKRWTLEATELCGNPVSEIEAVAVDVVTTDAILDKVAKNERKLDFLDPTDPAAAAAEQENVELLERVSRVAEKSKDPASVKAHAAAKLAKGGEHGKFATNISAHLKMTPEQEDSMLVRGTGIIAAGAGSGKTRVLAGKVIHHVQDLNTPISSIMAVSFSRKSSLELKARIIKYAAESGVALPPEEDRDAYSGIGTTHNIGRGILTQSGRGYRISADPKSKDSAIAGSELSNLVKVAILQVKMSGGEKKSPAPEDMSFFPSVGPDRTLPEVSTPALESPSPITNPSEGASMFSYFFEEQGRYTSLMSAAMDTVKDFLSADFKATTGQSQYGYWLRMAGPAVSRFGDEVTEVTLPSGSRLKWTPPKNNYPGAYFANSKSPWDVRAAVTALENYFGYPQARNALNLMGSYAARDVGTLEDSDKQTIQSLLSQSTVAAGLQARNVLVKTAAETDTSDPLAVSEAGIEAAYEAGENRVLDNEKGPYYIYARKPANEWFNLGVSDKEFETVDAKGKVKKLAASDFIRYIGLRKNSLVAPGAAFSSAGGLEDQGIGDEEDNQVEGVEPGQERVFAAVYGAYEWLKRNIADFKGRVDYDDQLILSSKELIANPALLRRYQQKYKCILVDEAQDLNKAQHVMFGLIAGYLDPATLKKRTDGKMSADTFVLIGDDKQAIYGFRGGVPEVFIDKSDLTPGGEGWTTKLLDTNFRSGSNIVDGANQLITHNKKQIKMVCKSNPAKGEGSLTRVPLEMIDEAGDYVASQIESAHREAVEDGTTKGFYKQYGLALRTNREVYGYVMKLIEKGIPFRSKKNPLKGPVVKPVLALFNMNATNIKARNQSVLDGTRCPDFGINGQKMGQKLSDAGVTDYYNALVNGDAARFVYKGGSYRDRLDQYIDYIQEVAETLNTQTADEMMTFVLSYKSPDGTTFVDTICANAKNDKEMMEEVQAIADQENDGDISPEMIRNAALGPINPLRIAAGRFPTAVAFNEYIQTLQSANDRTEKNEEDIAADAVQVDTVHGWKGLEVENLFLAMWDGGFPHNRSKAKPKLMEEERRLAYVAITRGVKSVQILEPKIVRGKPVEPSQFVMEACIPLVGGSISPTEDAMGKTASIKLADCIIPNHFDPEYGSEPQEVVETLSNSSGLEDAWSDYVVPEVEGF